MLTDQNSESQHLRIEKITLRMKRHTWRDWAMLTYFLLMLTTSLYWLSIESPITFAIYNAAALIFNVVGFIAVLLKLKRVEAVAIVMVALLLLSRFVLLAPLPDPACALEADCEVSSYNRYARVRTATDGAGAILPLSVLAFYRQRRGSALDV